VAVWAGVDVGGKRKGFDVAVIDDRRVLVLRSHLTCRQVVAAIVALNIVSFAVHFLLSPWLLVAVAIVAWIKFRPRRSQR
jgi:hypothetical protein